MRDGNVSRFECAVCGRGDLSLMRWRIGEVVSAPASLRQAPLCGEHSDVMQNLLDAIVRNKDPRGCCGSCGRVTEKLERWQVERVKSNMEPGLNRRASLCPECKRPLVEFMRALPPKTGVPPIRMVKSIDELLPSRALYVQQNGGRLPPPELGLR